MSLPILLKAKTPLLNWINKSNATLFKQFKSARSMSLLHDGLPLTLFQFDAPKRNGMLPGTRGESTVAPNTDIKVTLKDCSGYGAQIVGRFAITMGAKGLKPKLWAKPEGLITPRNCVINSSKITEILLKSTKSAEITPKSAKIPRP